VRSRFSTLQRRDAAPERREKGTTKSDERRARERGGATGVEASTGSREFEFEFSHE